MPLTLDLIPRIGRVFANKVKFCTAAKKDFKNVCESNQQALALNLTGFRLRAEYRFRR